MSSPFPADELEHRVLAETRYLRLVQAGHWTYAQRPNVRSAIAVVAVTDRDELVLVDQYRIPIRGRVIELPAGLVGDEAGQEQETLEAAAARELHEEAGYRATRLEVLTEAVSSPGLTDESVNLIWAEGVEQVSLGGGLDNEDIIVRHVPLADIPHWLQEQQRAGKRIDYKVFAGLYFLLQRRQIRGSH